MYTATITYNDRTDIYCDIEDWKMKDRIFSIKLKGDSYIFLPIYNIVEIEVSKNN